MVAVAVGSGPDGPQCQSWGWGQGRFVPEGRLLTGHRSGLIRVWSTRTWQCDRTLQGHEEAVTAVAAWGSVVVSGSPDGTVRLWDLPALRVVMDAAGSDEKVETRSSSTCTIPVNSEVTSLHVHARAGGGGGGGGGGEDFILCGVIDRAVRVVAASLPRSQQA